MEKAIEDPETGRRIGIHAMIPKICFVGDQYTKKNGMLLVA